MNDILDSFTIDNKNIIIRKCYDTDVKEFARVSVLACSETDYLDYGKEDSAILKKVINTYLSKDLKNSDSLYLVAVIDNKIVGKLSFSKNHQPRFAHRGEFGVSVLKEYQGLSIGTRLIKQMIKWAKNNGVTKIDLYVRSDNDIAIKCYFNLGFEKEGIITKYYLIDGKYYDALMMGLQV